jgi:type IV pilus assembly protein PilV
MKYPLISQAAGFTLLEVLVSILVLSFGLLGIAGLLLSTVQNNTIAAQRTTATFLAQDMADRIRQNINATKTLDASSNVKAMSYLNSKGTNFDCYKPAPASACATSQGVAERDLFAWRAQLAASLPGGDGIVCKDRTPDDGSQFDPGLNGCDGLDQSPWVIKIFWVVRPEDEVKTGTAVSRIQRFSMMVGGT